MTTQRSGVRPNARWLSVVTAGTVVAALLAIGGPSVAGSRGTPRLRVLAAVTVFQVNSSGALGEDPANSSGVVAAANGTDSGNHTNVLCLVVTGTPMSSSAEAMNGASNVSSWIDVKGHNGWVRPVNTTTCDQVLPGSNVVIGGLVGGSPATFSISVTVFGT